MNRTVAILLILLVSACSKSGESTKQSSELPSKPQFRVTKEYTAKEVNSFDSATLRIKRNEIFAQYGYIFKSPELSEYFKSKNWYEPQYNNVDSLLTERDKKNIQLFLSRETELATIRNFDCDQVSNKLSLFTFNSSISLAIDSLGQPYKTYVDKDEFCPIGQLHYWQNLKREYELAILGDSYSEDVNLKAKSRLYLIQTTNKFDVSDIGFSGIYLGEEQSLVELKLNCLVKQNPEFTLSKTSGASAVERFFTGDYTPIYVLTNGEIWIHFSINPFERLDYILFATMNVGIAC